MGTGERGEVMAVNCGGWASHSGERQGRGGGSQLQSSALGGQSIRNEAAAVTHNRDSQ